MTTTSGHAPAEERVEQMVGNLLRIGVLVAAAVALLGGIAFMIHHGSLVPDHSVFRGQPAMLSSLTGVIAGASALQPAAIVQLGIVLLIATPVARVLLTLIAFALQRDWMYVLISAIVLALLAYSLIVG
ncbi:MAG TPA: DUF1634 domain-containing protein [Gemmatimonadaceae bacterium]|nr:DUF1634 domain-containing protein [Gemmatimonadaceae bacterium]